jgi:hypothetical protein
MSDDVREKGKEKKRKDDGVESERVGLYATKNGGFAPTSRLGGGHSISLIIPFLFKVFYSQDHFMLCSH